MAREHQHSISEETFADERDYGAHVTHETTTGENEFIRLTDHEIKRLAEIRGLL